MDLKNILKDNTNPIITDSFIKANSVINEKLVSRVLCSVSGGADSDVMMDLIHKVDEDKKVDYVWFDTGLEYQATKDHLQYLENRYDVEIKRVKPIKSIPQSVKEYGVPVFSKQISAFLNLLVNHEFDWIDKPYTELENKYGRCNSALKWWCNEKGKDIEDERKKNMFNIAGKKWLKEFLLENPPQFKISKKCCDYAKKDVSKNMIKEGNYDILVIGVRKAEGGLRSTSYKNCFSPKDNKHKFANYRPLFWYSNKDRKDYEEQFGIIHSRCYTEYGLTRTGCVGCPYNIKILDELAIIEKYEPKLYKAACNVFKDAYEFQRKFKSFRDKMNEGNEKCL